MSTMESSCTGLCVNQRYGTVGNTATIYNLLWFRTLIKCKYIYDTDHTRIFCLYFEFEFIFYNKMTAHIINCLFLYYLLQTIICVYVCSLKPSIRTTLTTIDQTWSLKQSIHYKQFIIFTYGLNPSHCVHLPFTSSLHLVCSLPYLLLILHE